MSNGKMKSFFAGTCFIDSVDDCDTNTTCDLVGGASSAMPEGGNTNNGGGHYGHGCHAQERDAVLVKGPTHAHPGPPFGGERGI